MKVVFTDSFYESLKKMKRSETWWWKTWFFFRNGLPNFFRNIWFFRKELYQFRSWDYSFNLDLFRRSLEKLLVRIEHGYEVDSSRCKKVDKIKRVIMLINRFRQDNYVEIAEDELGKLQNSDWFEQEDTEEEKQHNRKIFNRANDLKNSDWHEIWKILNGQDILEYRKFYDSHSDEEKKSKNLWDEWFDGSDMRGWWD